MLFEGGTETQDTSEHQIDHTEASCRKYDLIGLLQQDPSCLGARFCHRPGNNKTHKENLGSGRGSRAALSNFGQPWIRGAATSGFDGLEAHHHSGGSGIDLLITAPTSVPSSASKSVLAQGKVSWLLVGQANKNVRNVHL